MGGRIYRITLKLITNEYYCYNADNNGELFFENRGQTVAIIQDNKTTIYPLENITYIEITEE